MSGPRAPGSGVAEVLAQEASRIEGALERALDDVTPELPSRSLPVLRHGVLAGGKRIRPVLCIASYRACGGRSVEDAFALAASLELIHAYSLMHDDLPCMDDAVLRRGRRTPHGVFGERATMTAATLLIPIAMIQLRSATARLGCSVEIRRRIVRELAVAAGASGMVGGQALDLFGEGRRLDPLALDDLHLRKTGALLAAAPVIGALASGADSELWGAFRGYGRALGLAFQIADDLLDATSSSGELGKDPSDHQLGKSTYPAVHGLEEARLRGWREVRAAQAALEGGGVDSPLLHALADYVMTRRR